jgi:hypothetical protein
VHGSRPQHGGRGRLGPMRQWWRLTRRHDESCCGRGVRLQQLPNSGQEAVGGLHLKRQKTDTTLGHHTR